MLCPQRETIWPFLSILACLFILAVAAPRAWQRAARDVRAQATLEDGRWPMAESARNRPRPVAQPVALPSPPSRNVAAHEALAELSGLLADLAAADTTIPSDGPRIASVYPRLAGPVMLGSDNRLAAAELPDLGGTSLFGLGEDLGEPGGPTVSLAVPALRLDEARGASRTTAFSPPAEAMPRREFPAEGELTGSDRALVQDPEPSLAVDSCDSKEPSAPGTAEEADAPTPPYGWPSPTALLARLDELGSREATSAWAHEVRMALDAVQAGSTVPDRDLDAVGGALDRLAELVREAQSAADRLEDSQRASMLLRVAYAVERRVDLWRMLFAIGRECSPPAPEDLLLAVSRVRELTGDSPLGQEWRDYLMLETIEFTAASDEAYGDRIRQFAARDVLDRLGGVALTARQREFLTTGPVGALGRQLYAWATWLGDPIALAQDVEEFEATTSASYARRIAQASQWLKRSGEADLVAIGRHLDVHYRNANVRLAMSAELLNRLVPERPLAYAPVRDTILGRPVRGHSLTESVVTFRPIPDPHRVLLGLEVRGQVAALTRSTTGPATFRNDSHSTYVARKRIELLPTGLQFWPSTVEVHNRTALRAVETEFDGLPFLGTVIRGVARAQHDQKRDQARREVEAKVAHRARQQVDTEAGARLGELSDRLSQRLGTPLSGLGLGPHLVDAWTAEDRFAMRMLLASDEQLGGHTPRPRAPAGSLASFQIHQSALNNLVERLDLNGRTFTLPELRSHIAARLQLADLGLFSDSPDEDVVIRFADDQAVHVRCREGALTLTLSIARLARAPRSWSDFRIHAHYRPAIDGLTAELVRDEVLSLEGQRLTAGSQIALRTVAARVFPRNSTIPVTPPRLLEDPHFADVVISQCVLDEGWLGIAIDSARRPDRAVTAAR